MKWDEKWIIYARVVKIMFDLDKGWSKVIFGTRSKNSFFFLIFGQFFT